MIANPIGYPMPNPTPHPNRGRIPRPGPARIDPLNLAIHSHLTKRSAPIGTTTASQSATMDGRSAASIGGGRG